MEKFACLALSSVAALTFAAGSAHADGKAFYFDLLVPEAVGETGSHTYDLWQHRGADNDRFVGNQTIKGGTFVGGGIGGRFLGVTHDGLAVGVEGGVWGGRVQGAAIPWSSQSVATHYEMLTTVGYALVRDGLMLHAAALFGFDGMRFAVSGPLSGIAAATPGSAATGEDGGYLLKRFDLRAGVQLGIHVKIHEGIALFADGTIDYDGQWRARGGVSFGGS